VETNRDLSAGGCVECAGGRRFAQQNIYPGWHQRAPVAGWQVVCLRGPGVEAGYVVDAAPALCVRAVNLWLRVRRSACWCPLQQFSQPFIDRNRALIPSHQLAPPPFP